MEKIKKTFPEVGDHCYSHTIHSTYYGSLVKNPYTVIEVNKTCIKIQDAGLIFYGPRYFDTLPNAIVENPNGRIHECHWSPKEGKWFIVDRSIGRYKNVLEFGKWDYFPYLD